MTESHRVFAHYNAEWERLRFTNGTAAVAWSDFNARLLETLAALRGQLPVVYSASDPTSTDKINKSMVVLNNIAREKETYPRSGNDATITAAQVSSTRGVLLDIEKEWRAALVTSSRRSLTLLRRPKTVGAI